MSQHAPGQVVDRQAVGVLADKLPPPPDTLEYGQQVGSLHPTGIISCFKIQILFSEMVQNNTKEERVFLLEVQVADLREDVTVVQGDVVHLDENLTELEGDVNFLFDEHIIQDERLLELEQTSDEVVVELAEINVNILGN